MDHFRADIIKRDFGIDFNGRNQVRILQGFSREAFQFLFQGVEVCRLQCETSSMCVPAKLLKKRPKLGQGPVKIETIYASSRPGGQVILNVKDQRRAMVFIHKP